MNTDSCSCCICFENLNEFVPICKDSSNHLLCKSCFKNFVWRHYTDISKFKQPLACPLCRSSVCPALSTICDDNLITEPFFTPDQDNWEFICRAVTFGAAAYKACYDRLQEMNKQKDRMLSLRYTHDRQIWFDEFNCLVDVLHSE